MSKEAYIEEYDRLYWEAIEEHGMSDADAAAWADHRAYGAMQDRYWDMVDIARQRAKDERL